MRCGVLGLLSILVRTLRNSKLADHCFALVLLKADWVELFGACVARKRLRRISPIDYCVQLFVNHGDAFVCHFQKGV